MECLLQHCIRYKRRSINYYETSILPIKSYVRNVEVYIARNTKRFLCNYLNIDQGGVVWVPFSILELSCDLKGNYPKNPHHSECEGTTPQRIPCGGHVLLLGRTPYKENLDSFRKCNRCVHKSMRCLPGEQKPRLFILSRCPLRGLLSEKTLCQ